MPVEVKVVKVAAAGVVPPINVASIVPPLISGVVSVIESETDPVFILVNAIGYSPIAFAACEAAKAAITSSVCMSSQMAWTSADSAL
jgi:hypothetical protein